MTEVWYKIEAWIPPEHAIGGNGYWRDMNNNDGFPYHVADHRRAAKDYQSACEVHGVRNVRLVQVTEEVVS